MLLSTSDWPMERPVFLDAKEDEGRSFWNRYYLERFHKMSTRLKVFQELDQQIYGRIPLMPNAVALEFGCGSGRGAAKVAQTLGISQGNGQLYAVDFSQEALELSNENLGDPQNILFKREDLRALSFEDESFDFVFDVFAATYMPFRGWQHAIGEAFRMLKPGGQGYFLYWKKGSDFGKCFRSQILVELFHNPLGLFWALHLKLVKGLNLWDSFIESGDVIYPEPEELVSEIEANGGSVEVEEDAFLNTCVFVKAVKR